MISDSQTQELTLNVAASHSWTEMLFGGTSQFKWMTQVEMNPTRQLWKFNGNLISYLWFASFQRIRDSCFTTLVLNIQLRKLILLVGPFELALYLPSQVTWLYFKLCIAQDSIGPSSRSLEHTLMKTYFVSLCAELG